jgi:hypothetical protein
MRPNKRSASLAALNPGYDPRVRRGSCFSFLDRLAGILKDAERGAAKSPNLDA